jgi:hypothetical protein
MKNLALQTGTLSKVKLPDGALVNPERAKALGFQVEDYGDFVERQKRERMRNVSASTQVESVSPMAARIAYLTAIEALPEATSRPAAASDLWSKYTAETMPVERAASFLRGLPEETKPVAATTSRLSASDIAIFQRKTELRITGLNMNADKNGDHAKRAEARKLSSALDMHARSDCSFGAAFTAVGLDARATITSILR